MTQFIGSYENRLDAKGRVSVPADFRAAIKGTTESVALTLRRSHIEGCVEVWPRGQGGRLQARLDALGPFDPERDWLETLLYTDAHQAETDAQGRISLPAELVELAGITDTVSFYGRGDHFQIWEPKAGAVYKEESRARGKAFVFGKPAP